MKKICARSTKSSKSQERSVSHNTPNFLREMVLLGIKKKKKIDSHASMDAGLIKNIVGKDFYRDDAVNAGHYSKKREGVADVDPKVRI